MKLNTPRQSVAMSAILATVAGCDLAFLDRPVQVVVIEAAEKPHLRYVPCAESEASTVLTFTVTMPATGTHQETFPLRPVMVTDTYYPSHPGGVVASCGPGGAGDQLPFNRSCFIESATENAIGIRFRLSCGGHTGAAVRLNELIWATIDRDAVIQLPHDATATAVFSTPKSQNDARQIE